MSIRLKQISIFLFPRATPDPSANLISYIYILIEKSLKKPLSDIFFKQKTLLNLLYEFQIVFSVSSFVINPVYNTHWNHFYKYIASWIIIIYIFLFLSEGLHKKSHGLFKYILSYRLQELKVCREFPWLKFDIFQMVLVLPLVLGPLVLLVFRILLFIYTRLVDAYYCLSIQG